METERLKAEVRAEDELPGSLSLVRGRPCLYYVLVFG
jgi:hypothetical protein